jgi:drug/metabolite transporter (DMT)-like permease
MGIRKKKETFRNRKKRMKLLDIIQLLILAALWGGSFLFLRIAAPIIGPIWLIEIRVLLAGLVLLLFTIRFQLLGEIRRNIIPIMVIGCIGTAIPFVLFAFASQLLPSGFTSILNATSPLFGTVVASIWLKEKLTINRILGLIIGFAGVIIIVGWKTFAITQSFIYSVSATFLAAFLYAVAAPYAKKYLSGVPVLAIATGNLLSAAIILLPLMPFTVPTQLPTTTVIIAVIALSLFSTACAHILYFRLLNSVGSTKSLTVTYLIPVFSMIWGKIFLQEEITQSMIFGCGLILLGTAITNDLLTGLFNQKLDKNQI